MIEQGKGGLGLRLGTDGLSFLEEGCFVMVRHAGIVADNSLRED